MEELKHIQILLFQSILKERLAAFRIEENSQLLMEEIILNPNLLEITSIQKPSLEE